MANLIIATIAILFFLSTIAEAQKITTFQRQYGPFNQTDFGIFEVVEPADIINDALQVTLDSASANFNLTYNSGRIILKQRSKLWDGNSTASFTTSFLVNVYRPKNDTPGEGIAMARGKRVLLPKLE